ncbi:imidazole glycerol phosphate synthase subunit HisH [Candidatus Methylopumilus planktonicus]|uniref:imidazole glycerol phosphate synthase subunit HisH n=1 Tax=Candidatus Methylopumilus planktonicus TaxID=1581557 RepID=UPI003D18F22C
MIHIVDYNLGNVQALLTSYKMLGINALRAKTADDLIDARKVILPGVGSFDHAMESLNQSGMRLILEELILHKKIPVLGICVGMQILASASEEGILPGLGWIPGKAKAFDSTKYSIKLPSPHMGWNSVIPVTDHPLFKDINIEPLFYFLHSYYFDCEDFSHIAATSNYGIDFSCAISSGNIYGVQFHPEKSHHFGSTILKNFSDL